MAWKGGCGGVPTRGNGVSEDGNVQARRCCILLWLSEVVVDGLECSETLHLHARNYILVILAQEIVQGNGQPRNK